MAVVTHCVIAYTAQRCEGVLSSQDIVAKESTKRQQRLREEGFGESNSRR